MPKYHKSRITWDFGDVLSAFIIGIVLGFMLGMIL